MSHLARRLAVLAAGSVLVLAVSACGRMGDPRLAPGQADSTPYPGGYPDGAERTVIPRSERVFLPPLPTDPR